MLLTERVYTQKLIQLLGTNRISRKVLAHRLPYIHSYIITFDIAPFVVSLFVSVYALFVS